jgi:hypothetical protein
MWQRKLREMAGVCGAKLDEDDEVEGCIRVTQEALGRYEHRSWLEWAGKELMPRLAEEVAAEEAEKAREEAEEREKRATEAKLAAEEAKREAEAEREAARQRREEERQAERDRKSGELLQRFQANAITGQEFQDGLAALEKDSSDGEMEQEDAAMEIVEVPKVQVGMKRREREDEEMTSATGDNRKVRRDRCHMVWVLMSRYDRSATGAPSLRATSSVSSSRAPRNAKNATTTGKAVIGTDLRWRGCPNQRERVAKRSKKRRRRS